MIERRWVFEGSIRSRLGVGLLTVIPLVGGCSDPSRQGTTQVTAPTEVRGTSPSSTAADATVKDVSPIKPH